MMPANILMWFLASMRINFNEEMCPEFQSELDLPWLAKHSYSVLMFSSSCHLTSTEDKIESTETPLCHTYLCKQTCTTQAPHTYLVADPSSCLAAILVKIHRRWPLKGALLKTCKKQSTGITLRPWFGNIHVWVRTLGQGAVLSYWVFSSPVFCLW